MELIKSFTSRFSKIYNTDVNSAIIELKSNKKYSYSRANKIKYLSKDFSVDPKKNKIYTEFDLDRLGDKVYNFESVNYIVDKSGKNSKAIEIEPEVALSIGGVTFDFKSYDEFRKTFNETNAINMISLKYHQVRLKFSFDINSLEFDKDILLLLSMTYKYINSEEEERKNLLNDEIEKTSELTEGHYIQYIQGMGIFRKRDN